MVISAIVKSPGPKLRYTVSNQGSLQMIINRCIYNVRYVSAKGTRRLWRCTDYARIRCPAYVTTENNKIVRRGCSHNHPFHDRRILGKIRKKAVFTSIGDAQMMGNVKKVGKPVDIPPQEDDSK